VQDEVLERERPGDQAEEEAAMAMVLEAAPHCMEGHVDDDTRAEAAVLERGGESAPAEGETPVCDLSGMATPPVPE
jgi:hypothetical protein